MLQACHTRQEMRAVGTGTNRSKSCSEPVLHVRPIGSCRCWSRPEQNSAYL